MNLRRERGRERVCSANQFLLSISCGDPDIAILTSSYTLFVLHFVEAGVMGSLAHIEENEEEKDPGKEPLISLDFLPQEALEVPTLIENRVNGVRENGLENKYEEEELREKEQDSEEDAELSEDEDKTVEDVDEPDSIDLSMAEAELSREQETKDDDNEEYFVEDEEYHAEDEAEEEAPKETDSLTISSFRQRTSSYMQATLINPVVKRPLSLGRKDSYQLATTHGLVDSLETNQTRHLSMFGPSNSDPSQTQTELKKLRISMLIEHERANESYIFPLVGAIPPSVLQCFVDGDHAQARLVSLASGYSSVIPATDDSSSVHTHISTSDVSTIAEAPSSTFEPPVLTGQESHKNSGTPSNLSNNVSPTTPEVRSAESPIDIEITYPTSDQEPERLFSESFTAESSLTSVPSSENLTPPTNRKVTRHLRSSSLPPPRFKPIDGRDSRNSISQVCPPP